MTWPEKSGPDVLSSARAELSPRWDRSRPQFPTSPAATEPAFSTAEKRFSTVRARMALVGWTLTELVTGEQVSYSAGRWGMSRALPDLAAVEAFAAQLGAPA